MKFLQWLLGTLFLTICVIALTLGTTWYAVQYELKRWMETPLDLSMMSANANKQPEAIASSPPQSIAVMATGTDPIKEPNDPSSQKPSESPVPSNVQPAPANSLQPAIDEPVVLSAEQFAARKDELTNQEKIRIYELFTKHLPETKLKHVSEWLENGLTTLEINQLNGLLQTYFPASARREIESIWLRWQPLPSQQPTQLPVQP